MAAYNVYPHCMRMQRKGYALWNPDPHREPVLSIGDVGCFRDGSWVRLFNTSLSPGNADNKFGVPDGYHPLQIGAIQEGTLSADLPFKSESVLQLGVEVGLTSGSIVQAGGSFGFECVKEQGAVLILGEDADRQDALQKHTFIRYILENHAAWLVFANQVHERGIHLNDLILVSGCDKTSIWACAVFSGGLNRTKLRFNVGQPGIAQGSMSIWGSWEHCQSVEAHSGPRGASSTAFTQVNGDGSKPWPDLPRTQCVFMRGFKICDRQTMLQRVRTFGRKKKLPYDGFTHVSLKKKRDDTDGPGPGPSRKWDPSQGSGDTKSSQSPIESGATDGSTSPNGNSSSQPEEQSGSSPSSGTDSLDSDFLENESAGGVHFQTYLDDQKEPDVLDLILEYIFKNSQATLALVHDDDLNALPENRNNCDRLEDWIQEVAPMIFCEKQVGMLEATHRAFYPDSVNMDCTLNTDLSNMTGAPMLDRDKSTEQSTAQTGNPGADSHNDSIEASTPTDIAKQSVTWPVSADTSRPRSPHSNFAHGHMKLEPDVDTITRTSQKGSRTDGRPLWPFWSGDTNTDLPFDVERPQFSAWQDSAVSGSHPTTHYEEKYGKELTFNPLVDTLVIGDRRQGLRSLPLRFSSTIIESSTASNSSIATTPLLSPVSATFTSGPPSTPPPPHMPEHPTTPQSQTRQQPDLELLHLRQRVRDLEFINDLVRRRVAELESAEHNANMRNELGLRSQPTEEVRFTNTFGSLSSSNSGDSLGTFPLPQHKSGPPPSDWPARTAARIKHLCMVNRAGNALCGWHDSRRERRAYSPYMAPPNTLNCGCTFAERLFEDSLARNGIGSVYPSENVRMDPVLRNSLLKLLEEQYGYRDGDFERTADGGWRQGEDALSWEQRATESTIGTGMGGQRLGPPAGQTPAGLQQVGLHPTLITRSGPVTIPSKYVGTGNAYHTKAPRQFSQGANSSFDNSRTQEDPAVGSPSVDRSRVALVAPHWDALPQNVDYISR